MEKNNPKFWSVNWEISLKQVELTNKFYREQETNPFVKKRIEKNVIKKNIDLSKPFIWKSLVTCLITTQQKSSPQSAVSRFLRTEPFPLDLEFCLYNINDLESKSKEVLDKFGGFRLTKKISKQLTKNLNTLIQSEWILRDELENFLKSEQFSPQNERELSNKVQELFVGLGPKQSRNFLQILGLTRYEIPIDSRIAKWLNKNNFPITVTSKGLSDNYYYEFILDGIISLCERCEIYPCELDAAIFSSYDKKQWTETNLVF